MRGRPRTASSSDQSPGSSAWPSIARSESPAGVCRRGDRARPPPPPPAPAGGGGGPPRPPPPPPPPLRSSPVASTTHARPAAGGPDPQLIELLARLFESIQTDFNLAPDTVAVLQRLQPTALRVALRDPSLLDRYDHALWRFMDQLAHDIELSAPAQRLRLPMPQRRQRRRPVAAEGTLGVPDALPVPDQQQLHS